MTHPAHRMRRFAGTGALALTLSSGPADGLTAQNPAQVPDDAPARIQPLPTLREQAVERQEWLELRIGRVLPQLMAEYDVRMWILSMREYAEDPVFWSIISPTTFAARRRSIYVFTRQDDGTVERLELAVDPADPRPVGLGRQLSARRARRSAEARVRCTPDGDARS